MGERRAMHWRFNVNTMTIYAVGADLVSAHNVANGVHRGQTPGLPLRITMYFIVGIVIAPPSTTPIINVGRSRCIYYR